MKGDLIYVAKKDFQRCGTRPAPGFKKSTYLPPASVNRMGGYYTARTQRVDMLDRVGKKSGNQKPPDRVGLFKP
jgi:hypothetical protein